MIRRDGRFQGCKDVNLARAADLENGSATIADVQILFGIESNSGRDTHAFHVWRHTTRWRHLINDPILAARNIQRSGAIESQSRGVHHIADERLRSVVEIDLVNRYGCLLAPRT